MRLQALIFVLTISQEERSWYIDPKLELYCILWNLWNRNKLTTLSALSLDTMCFKDGTKESWDLEKASLKNFSMLSSSTDKKYLISSPFSLPSSKSLHCSEFVKLFRVDHRKKERGQAMAMAEAGTQQSSFIAIPRTKHCQPWPNIAILNIKHCQPLTKYCQPETKTPRFGILTSPSPYPSFDAENSNTDKKWFRIPGRWWAQIFHFQICNMMSKVWLNLILSFRCAAKFRLTVLV